MSIVETPADSYHDGTAIGDEPAISKSIIHELLTRSPLHAWHQHPKLNSAFAREDDGRFDLGTAAHAMFLENDDTGVVVLDFDNYTTKAAKEARDYARSIGQIPMLQKYWDRTSALVEATRDGAAGIDATPKLFMDGKPEQTLVWREGPTLCKARPDFLHDDLTACDDMKTTARLAAPERVAGLMIGTGYDVQAAFYLRGLRACGGSPDATFRFLFVETEPPHAVACYSPSPAMIAMAEQKIDFALGLWRECLETDRWPGYPARVMHVDPPGWSESQMYEREYREEAAA